MKIDRYQILTAICLLAANLVEVDGKTPTVRHSRLNGLHFEDQDHHRQSRPNYSTQSKNPGRSMDVENSRKIHDEEEKLFRVITSKDYRGSSPSELENFDRIGEQMINRANLTEEAKRVVRQVKRQRPGFFWTLARVAFETVNETRSAIEQISVLVSNNIAPETTTVRGGVGRGLGAKGATTEPTITTTSAPEGDGEEEPFKLTPSELQTLVRRNLRGLIRLFNIEWRDALNQSQANVREFQRDLGNRISPFLQDNPDVV